MPVSRFRSARLRLLVAALALPLAAACSSTSSRTAATDSTASSVAAPTSTSAATTTSTPTSVVSTTGAPTTVRGGGGGGGGGTVTATTASPLLYIVPNITGIDVAVAEQMLSERQLGSLYVIVDDWQTAKGTVLSQTQAPGTVLGPGGIVAFRVSTGPVVAQIPNVVGLCEAAARTALNNAGFNVTMVYEQNAAKWKRVFGQTPLGSIFDQQGSTVTIKVSLNVTKDGC